MVEPTTQHDRAYGAVGIEVVALCEVRDLDVAATHDPPVVGSQPTGKRLQQRGLAGPVAADHPYPVADGDPDAHPVEQRASAVRPADTLQCDQRRR